MKVTLWGTRGSLASPGPETTRYGGNTACVQVEGADGTLLVLDAGTGIRRLGAALPGRRTRVDVLLTHLHLDHIQGLGFFAPIYSPDTQIFLWGPPSKTQDLRARLERYLSPPLFPVRLRDLPRVECREVERDFDIGEFHVHAARVAHPGLTVGYRITSGASTLAYLPDHEPALGVRDFPQSGAWTSGYSLAHGADLLIHDAQYTREEYLSHAGWGHSSWPQAIAFARHVGAKRLLPFHHDPDRTDSDLDRLYADCASGGDLPITPAAEGAQFELP